jgi:DUF1016 N-terminal domain
LAPGNFLSAVTDRIHTGRHRDIADANTELALTYQAVGNEILARQDAEGWGARVNVRLSADLRERFPDARGFSARNLRYMHRLRRGVARRRNSARPACTIALVSPEGEQ